MQRKKQTKPIKQIILFTIIVILALLLIFAEDIIKLTSKNQTNLAENTPNDQIELIEPNIPVLSAGMIPVKWDGTNWVITTQNDTKWYDYKNGKPAYIMLNDGTYQSELIRGMEQNGKKLASDAVGNDALVVPSDLGTIFMWVPRFAYNEQGDIKYIKNIELTDKNWIIPDIFTYEQTSETTPDFLLTGIWIEKDVDSQYSSKINEMNQEESKYGFIKNTIAVSSNQITQNEIQKYINIIFTNETDQNTTVGASIARQQITDITNSNRIILRIINQNNQDPIKATGYYNKDTGLITVQVTYSQYGIEKILYENTQELNLTKTNNKATATSEGLNIEYGTAKITIIDNKGNTKELEIAITSRVYATLYADGTLAFSKTQNPLPEKGTPIAKYSDISEYQYEPYTTPWNSKREQIITVEIVDKIAPKSTASWFTAFRNLTQINNLSNLNTANVTNMKWMFSQCDKLSTLDVSNLNTSKVTNMEAMFSNCNGLTNLDVSNFNTSNVTSMFCMFQSCENLINLDVSNFNTSNVTDMERMFGWCSKLTNLNISNFDTANVTNMNSMFKGCENLTSLDLNSFDTSKVIDMSYMFYECKSLTLLELNSLNTSKVIDMSWMFHSCSSLTSLDLSSFDTSSVIDIGYIFNNCTSLAQITFGEKWDKEITLPRLAKPCTGWYSDAEFTNKVANAGANYKPVGPITIYADVPPNIYVKLYTDGTLAFASNNSQIEGKTLSQDYGNIAGQEYNANSNYQPWYDRNNSPVTTVEFVDKVKPTSTAFWFHCCTNLTRINNIENLDTRNVTDMNFMFNFCDSLEKLDVSNFNTSKVTNMRGLVRHCISLKELDVSNFNTSNVTNMSNMFDQCSSLTSLDLSNFDTSNLIDMWEMFSQCANLTSLNISSFDTSNVTDMSTIFYGCSSLTSLDISNFNTSNVISMQSMFEKCSSLTSLNLSNFDTRKVTYMTNMFSGCNKLTELDLSSFDTSSINTTNIPKIFASTDNLIKITFSDKWTKSFALPVPTNEGHTCEGWYSDSEFTNKVADAGASYTPTGNITIYANMVPDIYVKLYTDGTLAFCSNNSQIPFKTLEQDYGNIAGQEYYGNAASVPWLNQKESIKTAVIIDEIIPVSTSCWFVECKNLTIINNIRNLNTSNVKTMGSMFYNCNALTALDLSSFNTSKVTKMTSMFRGCSSLTNLDLSDFDTSNVTDMWHMFSECSGLTTLNLRGFDTSKVTDMRDMLQNCSNLTQITFGEKWDKSITLPTPIKEGYTCTGWYSDAEFINKVADVGANYTPKGPITIYANLVPLTYATLYTDGTLAFGRTENPLPEKTISVKYGNIPAKGYNSPADAPWYNNSAIKTVNFVDEIYLNSAYSLFNMCQGLVKVENLGNLKGVTNIAYMFNSCYELVEIDMSNFDTSKVTDMNYTFCNCRKLTKLDLSNFDTSNVTDMSTMFDYCESLTELDLSNFDTSKVSNMQWMFSGCSGLTELNVTNFDTSNVTNMAYMFSGCSGLQGLNVANFNTSNVTNMTRMFNSCNGLKELDISNFDTRNATAMNNMFSYSRNLKIIYVGENWTTDNATTTEMFYNCGTSTVTRK